MMANEPPHDWHIADFDFTLPPACIAQMPVEPRDHAQLLHVTSNTLTDHHVYDLPGLLRAGDLLVMNDTKVIPARLYGQRGTASIEIMLHKKQALQTWLAFARPGKKLRVGDTVSFADDFTGLVLDKRDSGEILISFSVDDNALFPLLHRYGEPPLPPYIKRAKGEAQHDKARYQTVYAAHEGAVAAPTAGLHFTPELLTKLAAQNIQQTTVTLHVGAGTFLPVKVERLKDHVMHAEWGEVSTGAADEINKAKREGRRIVAIGTTSLRLLESAADEQGFVRPFANETAIFIYPGYRFKSVDALMTNFHLPKSTLFMLVSAFAGLKRMHEAYNYALAKNYRFYSYGDASLLERSPTAQK